jgi:hypothetical protein
MEVSMIEIKVIIIRKITIVIVVHFVKDVAVEDIHQTVEIKEKMEVSNDEVVVTVLLAV